MTVAGTRDVADLVRLANSLPADTPPHQIAELMRSIRSRLATGIVADTQTLREYLSIAHRFDHTADVWNAAQLLEEHDALDPSAKVARASAWMRLFPDSARRRPKIVLKLLGNDGTGGASATSLSGLLTNWLAWAMASYERSGNPESLIGSLLAAEELARCWWPVDFWVDRAPAFASMFVETALAAAAVIRRGDAPDTLGTARALSVALGLQRLGLEALETGAEASELDVASKNNVHDIAAAFSAPTDDELKQLTDTLNRTKRRIWVIGALNPKWEHLMGVAKTFGLSPDLFQHIGYQEVKQRPVIHRVDLVRDFGILLGPVPHSANELGGYSSLSTQLRQETGVNVIELRAQSTSQELRITKTSFRDGLFRLLTEGIMRGATYSSGPSTPSASAAVITP